MKPAKPVLWHQGLFLQPQHFQQFDLYVQSLLTPFSAKLSPHFWGVCGLEIGRDALRDLVFGVESGEFIFPDGTWAAVPGNARVAPRQFRKEELEAGRSFRVYLGLRSWDPVRANVTVLREPGDLAAAGTRFIAETGHEELRDLHQSGPAAPVRLMEYVIRVFTESETANLADWSLIPAAEMEYDGAELRVSAGYVPPIVTIGASETIRQIVQSVREQVASQTSRLEEYKVPRDARASDFDPGFFVFLLALRTLNRYAPELAQLADAPVAHPWTVYGLFGRLVGELSAFTDRVNAFGQLADGTELLPKYDHANVLACFSEARTLIGELLGTIAIGPERIVHLQRKAGFFTAKLPVEVFEGRHTFYLVLKTAETRSRVLEVMERIAKVSSVEYMRTLIGRALPGIGMEYSPATPHGLPNRPDTLYFLIDQSHPQWTEIRKNQSICLWWDQAPRDTKVEFVVLRK